jgi:hypothetical protein
VSQPPPGWDLGAYTTFELRSAEQDARAQLDDPETPGDDRLRLEERLEAIKEQQESRRLWQDAVHAGAIRQGHRWMPPPAAST